MNSVFLIGRLTKDPELRFIADSGKGVAKFTLAVDREFSKEKVADFFIVIVWGKQAESVATYLTKGSLVGIRGRVQNRNYENKEGNKVFITEIIAERVEFLSFNKKDETEKKESKDEPDSSVKKKDEISGFESIDKEPVPF